MTNQQPIDADVNAGKGDKTNPLLAVEDLKMYFPVYGGVMRRKVAQVFAVDGVSFSIRSGETLGLVGESGCGKTTVGRTLLRLYKPTGGRGHFDGRNIMTLDRGALQDIRRDMQIIFQDPFESLNARHTIEEILEEPFRIHRIGSPAERRQRVRRLLERVGLPSNALSRFPHEFSGGQRQRIGIARAGIGPGCLHPVPGHQSAAGTAAGDGSDLPLYRPRSRGGETHFRLHRGHVSGTHRGVRRRENPLS